MATTNFLVGVIQFVNLFAAALVAGGQVCVLLVIVPTKRQFPTRMSVEVHNAMLGHQIDYYMKPSGITSLLTAIAVVLLGLPAVGWISLPDISLLFYCLGMLGTVGVIICSRFFNVKTNAMMAKWELDRIPDNYPEVRRKWDLVHTIRASCGVTAFTGYALATLTFAWVSTM